MNSCTVLNCFLHVYSVRDPKEIKRGPRAGIHIVNRRSNHDVDGKNHKGRLLFEPIFSTKPINENDVLFSNDTGKLAKTNSECSYEESNLRPSDY